MPKFTPEVGEQSYLTEIGKNKCFNMLNGYC